MAGPTHARAFAEAIHHSGRPYAFGPTAGRESPLPAALAAAGVEVLRPRRDSAALAMAEGYAWVTGRPAVCLVSPPPSGLGDGADMTSSLLAASRHRSPVVVIVTEHDGPLTFEHDSEPAYRRMWPGEDPAAVLSDALSLAGDRLRPVVVGVDAALLTSPVRLGAVTLPAPRPRVGLPAGDDAAVVRRLAWLLARSQRPVLVAGRCVLNADLMRALAEHTGAALATTPAGKGLFDGHPQDLGLAGELAHPAAERVLRRADLMLCFGTGRPGRRTGKAHVVCVGEEESGGWAEGDGGAESLIGNPAEVLSRLPGAVTARAPWFAPVGAAAECWLEDLRDHAPPIPAGTVDPRRVLAEIDRLIPVDAVVVVGDGFPCALVSRPGQGRWMKTHEGLVLPTAIGVARGAPHRKVVAFESEQFEAGDLGPVDLTLFVLNDGPQGLAACTSTIDAIPYGPIVDQALRPGAAVVDVRTASSVIGRHLRASPSPQP
jgi:acetolactate synthase-1/2/3 large subunit